MIDFLTIVLLVFGVLQIVLFFKIWGMTNDIREMRNKYLKDEDEKVLEEVTNNPLPRISNESKTRMGSRTITPWLNHQIRPNLKIKLSRASFPGFFFKHMIYYFINNIIHPAKI